MYIKQKRMLIYRPMCHRCYSFYIKRQLNKRLTMGEERKSNQLYYKKNLLKTKVIRYSNYSYLGPPAGQYSFDKILLKKFHSNLIQIKVYYHFMLL